MAKAPFPIDQYLTGIAIAYRNPMYIADLVLPRIPVGAQEFKYWEYKLEEAFTLPETRVGRRSKPNETEFSAVEKTGSTIDYGLDSPIPQNDIDNAPANHNPVDHAVMSLTDLVMLDREVRVAAIVFALATYNAALRITLAGNDQWNSGDAAADPVADISTGLDAPLVRPNTMVIGRLGFSALQRNPKIIAAVNKNDSNSGIAAKQAIADLFELKNIYVGESFYNTAKKGQAFTQARVWGKHCALIYQDPLASTASENRPTFGYTAAWGNKIAGAKEDSDIGLKGGQRARSGESVGEFIVGKDAAYFLKDVAA